MSPLFLAALVLAQPLVLEGEVGESGPDFLELPITVPPGTKEIRVEHPPQPGDNTIDYGLWAPEGPRGWGGGNEEPIVVGTEASSRSYRVGPITPGTWNVVLGRARLRQPPGKYKVTVTFSSQATLPAQPDRGDAGVLPAVKTGAAWYAGDFHVHSRESGDAENVKASLPNIARFLKGNGLDFVVLTDHNTVSQADFIAAARREVPEVLLIPGVEFTTYKGHATVYGARQPIDHRIGLPGITLESALDAVAAQGALFAIAHPRLDLGGNVCIGCKWEHPIDRDRLNGVEVRTAGDTGVFFYDATLAFWETTLSKGHHIAALGGSDDHSGGTQGDKGNDIGEPTTLVFASELSEPAILEGVKKGRTVVKLTSRFDPFVSLHAEDAGIGDEVAVQHTTIRAVVTGGLNHRLDWVKNGADAGTVLVTEDPFTATLEVDAPAEGSDRYRVQLDALDAGTPRPATVTSHLWVKKGDETPPAPKGCGCDVSGGVSLGLVALIQALKRSSKRSKTSGNPS